ncbi:MAG TPA: restriction endonuclease [Solirubrobacterales bacterium]|nr:restriction endonuclease [Solirubrobacterales bacterium]
MLEIKQADPADALTEAILAAAAPGLIDRDLIAAAEPDVEILSSFLSQISTARKCGLSLGQLLAPFSRPTLLDPQRAPLDPDALGAVELSAQLVSVEMLRLLAANPERLHELTPRQFEEVVAELFAKQGYDVTLTATSRDGGADLYVVDNNAIGSFLYLVECKRYHPGRPVGVGIVRGLFGAAQAAHATAGIVATSSYFTRDARAFQQEVQYQVSLRDFAALQSWLRQAQ